MRGRFLELAHTPNPGGEFGLRVLATEMRQLQMRVTVDEAGQQLGVGKVERPNAARRRYTGIWSDGRDPSSVVNKNGAVLEGRRRDRMHSTSSNPEQGLRE